MNRFIPLTIIVLSFVLFGYHYKEPTCDYTPILMTREQLNSSIRFEKTKKMINPGKIYLKGKYLYIVEKFEGIHIVDNSNRVTPTKIGFVHIPGCIDLAIKNNSLYADNATDLITIDISNLQDLKVTSRTIDVFPELVPEELGYIPNQFSKNNRPEGTVIVAWLKNK